MASIMDFKKMIYATNKEWIVKESTLYCLKMITSIALKTPPRGKEEDNKSETKLHSCSLELKANVIFTIGLILSEIQFIFYQCHLFLSSIKLLHS